MLFVIKLAEEDGTDKRKIGRIVDKCNMQYDTIVQLMCRSN